MEVKFCEHRRVSRTCYVVSETKVPHTPQNCIIRKNYESICSSIEFHERSERKSSNDCRGGVGGTISYPRRCIPQHVTTTLDALKSVKNTSAKQLYTL